MVFVFLNMLSGRNMRRRCEHKNICQPHRNFKSSSIKIMLNCMLRQAKWQQKSASLNDAKTFHIKLSFITSADVTAEKGGNHTTKTEIVIMLSLITACKRWWCCITTAAHVYTFGTFWITNAQSVGIVCMVLSDNRPILICIQCSVLPGHRSSRAASEWASEQPNRAKRSGAPVEGGPFFMLSFSDLLDNFCCGRPTKEMNKICRKHNYAIDKFPLPYNPIRPFDLASLFTTAQYPFLLINTFKLEKSIYLCLFLKAEQMDAI